MPCLVCLQQRRFMALTEEFAISGLRGARTSALRRGSRIYVLIEGSLTRLRSCGNETPAANEDRLDCIGGRERAKRGLRSPSVYGLPLLLHPPPAPPPPLPALPLLCLHRAAAISHLLINFLGQQIMMLFSFAFIFCTVTGITEWFQLHPCFLSP